MKFKFFKNEQKDQQKEKDIAYKKVGFNLIKQKQLKDIIIREYKQ